MKTKKELNLICKLLKARSDWFIKEFQRFALTHDIDLEKVVVFSHIIKAIAENEPISNRDAWLVHPQNMDMFGNLKDLKTAK